MKPVTSHLISRLGCGALAVSCLLAASAPRAHAAPGTVTFNNNNSCKIINGQTGLPATVGDNVHAALYWALPASGTFVPIGATVNVGVPGAGLFAGGTRTTGAATTGGTSARFQVRAWSGTAATYEDAMPGDLIGESLIFTNLTGNPGGAPPVPPVSIAGPLQGFTLTPKSGPTLTVNCPTNKSVTCSDTWTFDEPTASTTCTNTNVTVVVISSVTNTPGCSFAATRTWAVTDSCGNSNNCSQAVTVLPSPPTLLCTNLTITCGTPFPTTPPPVVGGCCTNIEVSLIASNTTGSGYAHPGNGNSGFGGAVGLGSLALMDNGTTVFGQITKGPGDFNDALVIYIDTGAGGGFASTSGFADDADGLRRAISGFDGGANRSVLTFTNGFAPTYAIALGPASDNFGGLWQLANGGANSLGFISSVNLDPTGANNSPTYTFSFDVAQIGLAPNSGSTFRFFGTYISDTGYRSDEAVAGNDAGTNGWNPFQQLSFAAYTIGSTPGMNACTQTVMQTWQAVDPCCNQTNTCVRTVTVLPSAPMLLCTNLTISCGDPIPTNPPTVIDSCCTNVIISLIGSTTTTNGCTVTITQAWQAVDQCCGGSDTCVRTIVVQDTTLPFITGNTNRTVQCGSGWTWEPPTAADACCGTNLSFVLLGSSVVTQSLCETVWAGTWQVTDWCGNSTLCTQTVSVVESPATLFADDFDSDHTANWVVNKSTGANANDPGSSAEFFFDYSTVGIPPAPHSVGGTTRGLRLRANMYGSVFSGLSVSPLGQGFSGDYQLEFDLWMNYNGPLGPGGNGTTQLGGAGIGTTGATSQWAGAETKDGLWFVTTGDANSTLDYRAYSTAYPSGYPASSGVYAAGTGSGAQNNTYPYYFFFAPQPAPAAQIALYPQQAGLTYNGAIAFAWRDVVITKIGNQVTWSVDGLVLAMVDTGSLTLSTNILFTYFDSNSSSSTDPNAPDLLFALIDNVRVEPATDLNCPTNKTVTCDSNWTFDPPMPTTCTGSNLTVNVLTTITNGTCPQLITRIWTFVNPCDGQTNTCSQLVTVVNTNPPVITCTTNKTVNCGDNWGFDLPSAYDSCTGSNLPVYILSTVTNGGCPPMATRIWVASNACDTASVLCTQVVTMVDTTPPVITCAGDKTVPADSEWVFDTPSAYDTCCGSNVTVQLISISMVPVSECQSNWTAFWQASDCCSNISTCAQTVSVVLPIVPRTNVWVNMYGGFWADMYSWSQGPPRAGDVLFITNGVNQTINLGVGTSPCDLTVSTVVLDEAGGFGTNNLLLANGATNSPLHVLNDLILGSGGQLTISDSQLQVDGLTSVGTSGAAGFTLNSGAATLGGFTLASGSNSMGQLNLSGGTITVLGNCTAGAGPNSSTGIVSVTGGALLSVPNGILGLGNGGTVNNGSGSASLTVSDGTLIAAGAIIGSTAGGVGVLTLQSNALVMLNSNLTVVSSSLTATSTVTIAGGSLLASNATVQIGSSGAAVLTITGGSHVVRELNLGGTNSSGSFYGLGGYLKILETLRPNFTVGNGIDVDGSGGTIIIGDGHNAELKVWAGAVTNFSTMTVGYSVTPAYTGAYTQTGGVTHVTNNLVVGDCPSGAQGFVSLSGGATYVTNDMGTASLNLQKGSITMNNGSKLVVDTLDLSGSCGQFFYNGGSIHYNQLVLPANAPPLRLNITLNSPTSVTLSWPSLYVGYALQQTADLVPTAWSPAVPVSLSDDGATRSATISPIPGSMFYRLSKP